MLGYVCAVVLFFFKQKTAYEMRISDWSSDVCSSDLVAADVSADTGLAAQRRAVLDRADYRLRPHYRALRRDDVDGPPVRAAAVSGNRVRTGVSPEKSSQPRPVLRPYTQDTTNLTTHGRRRISGPPGRSSDLRAVHVCVRS